MQREAVKGYRGFIALIMAAACATGALAFISDFNGTYLRAPGTSDPWCGKRITLKKIRFNRYRISWELLNGEVTVVELTGVRDNNTLDFRKESNNERYGYTYTLAEGNDKLIVTLTVPSKSPVVCHFRRIKD